MRGSGRWRGEGGVVGGGKIEGGRGVGGKWSDRGGDGGKWKGKDYRRIQ